MLSNRPRLAPVRTGRSTRSTPTGSRSRPASRRGWSPRPAQSVPGTSYLWHTAPDGGADVPDRATAAGSTSPTARRRPRRRRGHGALRRGRQRRRGAPHPRRHDAATAPAARRRGARGCRARRRRPARCGSAIPPASRPRSPGLRWVRSTHEAAAVDPVRQHVYLTEDQPDGGLYRFRPTTWGDLSAGTLEVMTEVSGVARVGDRARSRRHADAVPRPGADDEGLQRRRGRLVRPRQGVLHHQGRQPGVDLRPGRQRARGASTTTATSPHARAHRRRQRHRSRVRRRVRRRGRRQHGARHPRAPRATSRRSSASTGQRLRDHRPGVQPRRARACTSARSATRGAPTRSPARSAPA